MVERTLKSLLGEYDQTPPRFSALKQQGKRAYQLARKGIDFSLKPRKINIKVIELISFNLPIIEIKTTVSKGTYIRALARDVGNALKCGTTLDGLTRTRIGKFTVENSVVIDEIKPNNIAEIIYPINEVLSDIPAIVVSEQDILKLIKGQAIQETESRGQRAEIGTVRVVDNQNRVLIMGKYKDNKIYPDRLIYADIEN
jgi:tRNA pseudouridine55 synthase